MGAVKLFQQLAHPGNIYHPSAIQLTSRTSGPGPSRHNLASFTFGSSERPQLKTSSPHNQISRFATQAETNPCTMQAPVPKGELGKKACILSIDGGGVRGIIPSVLLEHLESELQKLDGEDARIADYFDLVTGTSTGGLVAALLTLPENSSSKRPRFRAKDITKFYLDKSSTIFPVRSGFLSGARNLFASLTGPKRNAQPLEKILREYMGDLKLTDTIKPIVIPSFDIKTELPILFSTKKAQIGQFPDCYLRDVCRATTAAPTFFAPYNFKAADGNKIREFNAVDGGIVANNPAFISVTEFARGEIVESQQRQVITPKLHYEDLLLLSLGTGEKVVSYDSKETSSWGSISWIYHNGTVPLYNLVQINFRNLRINWIDSSQENLQSLVSTATNLLGAGAKTRNEFGDVIPENRWETNDAGLSRFAQWLVEERKAGLSNNSQPSSSQQVAAAAAEPDNKTSV